MGTPTRSHGGERFTRVECRAMGTDVVVLLDGVRGATARAAVERYVVDRLEHLEARWSRFRPTSDVSVLNAAGAHPVVVAPETFEL
ncbi:MAG: FAD:protein FMN transferase, partial [Acidimicrobiia bacterium]